MLVSGFCVPFANIRREEKSSYTELTFFRGNFVFCLRSRQRQSLRCQQLFGNDTIVQTGNTLLTRLWSLVGRNRVVSLFCLPFGSGQPALSVSFSVCLCLILPGRISGAPAHVCRFHDENQEEFVVLSASSFVLASSYSQDESVSFKVEHYGTDYGFKACSCFRSLEWEQRRALLQIITACKSVLISLLAIRFR